MAKGSMINIPHTPKSKIVTALKVSIGKDVPIDITGKKGK